MRKKWHFWGMATYPLTARFRALESKEAQAVGQKKGASKGGKTAGRGRRKASGINDTRGNRDDQKRTAAKKGKAVGVSGAAYERKSG